MTVTAFGPLQLEHDDRVIAPRSWTVEAAQWCAELDLVTPPGPVLDLCAGVGGIGLLAATLTGRALVLVDVDPVCCEYATHNALAAGVGDRVDVRCTSVENAMRPAERFALIAADPPYLPTSDAVRPGTDPVLAVDGGTDGLDLVRLCLRVASDHLVAGGTMVCTARGLSQCARIEAELVAEDLRLSLTDVRSFGPERAVVRLVSW